jgi:hypothetical protein
MIRKATALALLLLFGLYLPAAAMPVCLCIGPAASIEESCCADAGSCCGDQGEDGKSCCGDPECCIVIAGIPDGMEPQPTQLPLPLSAPLPTVIPEAFVPVPSLDSLVLTQRYETPPPPGDPIRIAFGVWRL